MGPLPPLFFWPPAVTKRAKRIVTIRPINVVTDLNALARVHYFGFFDKYGFLCVNRCFFERWRIELWVQFVYSQLYAKCCADKLTRCAVAVDDSGEIVGIIQMAKPLEIGDMTLGMAKYAGARCDCANELYIERLAVAPHARGSGVGKALLDWATEYGRTHGRSVLTLGVMWTNPAIRLYKREGFTIDKFETYNPFNVLQCPLIFAACGQRYCFVFHMSKRLLKDGGAANPTSPRSTAALAPEPYSMDRDE